MKMKKIEIYTSSRYDYVSTEEEALKKAKLLLSLGFDVKIMIREAIEVKTK